MSANLLAVFYLISGVLFILALRGLSSPKTSRQGNLFGILGMLLAIIVTFLGRLHPLGIIFASLIIALTYLGAEDAQLFMQIPAAVGFLFQGLVLFYLLGADFLVKYKFEFKISK